MESLQLKPWGKKFFENIESEAPISLILYREDDCEIYELPDNRIIKLSSSNEGYNTVTQLCGKQNKNIVDVYQHGCFECTNHTNDDEELIYYIIMEKLNTDYIPSIIISQFVNAFQHCWFIQYKNDYIPIHRHFSYADLKTILSNPNNPDIEIVRKYITSYVNSENKETILSLYKETYKAYQELYLIAPDAKIDFNEGNIGFTKDGTLKYFDLQ